MVGGGENDGMKRNERFDQTDHHRFRMVFFFLSNRAKNFPLVITNHPDDDDDDGERC